MPDSTFLSGRARAIVLAIWMSSGCADPAEHGGTSPSDADVDVPEVLRAESAAARPSLARGKREILVENIAAVENVLFTSSGRLLVSGDDGVYELTREESGRVAASALVPRQSCKFSGLAQLGTHVYAGCYDGTRSFLYGAPESSLAFARIGEIDGVQLANGLAADTEGHLYVSGTFQAKIVRLTIAPTAPLAIAAQDGYRTKTGGLLPNGLDVYEGNLYWGDFGTVRRAPLARPELTPTQLASQLTLLDDLHVDARGLLVADFLGNTVRAYDLRGRRLSVTPAVFQSPSAVVPALGRLGFGAEDLIVTEKGGNRVSVYRVP